MSLLFTNHSENSRKVHYNHLITYVILKSQRWNSNSCWRRTCL